MLTKMLAATAALTLAAGAPALAAQKAAPQGGPKQPIPYSQLDAYAKASPKLRASKDWWAGSTQAETGLSTDTSAAAPMSTQPSSTSSGDTAVNPTPMAAPPSLPSTPPTDTDPARAADPMPMTPGTAPTVPPMQPK
jgi:hypothetical protein